MTQTAKKINWPSIVGGAVLVVASAAVLAFPGEFLGILTIVAGASFIFSGIMGLIWFFRYNPLNLATGMDLLLSILDIVAGVLLVAYPASLSVSIPWALGVTFIVFGIVELVGLLPFSGLVPKMRATVIISGVLLILFGILFIWQPTALSICLAVFMTIRGIAAIVMGFSVGYTNTTAPSA